MGQITVGLKTVKTVRSANFQKFPIKLSFVTNFQTKFIFFDWKFLKIVTLRAKDLHGAEPELSPPPTYI